jgi:uncharacterized protein with PQ loop repeat
MSILGIVCIGLAACLELLSYYKQVAKTLRTRHSKDVSSSAYVYKLIKYVITILGLAIYNNYVGMALEIAAFLFCLIALLIIVKYKPKGWRLF